MRFEMRNVLLPIICSMLLLFAVSEELCGKPFFKPIFPEEDRTRNRISNGIEARMHSLPWQAFILVKDPKMTTTCGGSLIHWKNENASNLVLTAAHCLIDWERFRRKKTAWEKMKTFFSNLFKGYNGVPLAKVNDVVVYLGVHDLMFRTRAMQRLQVTGMEAAKFDSFSLAHDIALLKLEKRVPYNIVIQGVCMPDENEGLPPPETPCLLAGWGRLVDGKRASRLQQFQTHIINGTVNNPHFQEDLMICTGSKRRNSGARKGDSGGPLVCLKNGRFVAYGVVSFIFRARCTNLTDRQAFTKVTRYLPWLKKSVAKLTV